MAVAAAKLADKKRPSPSRSWYDVLYHAAVNMLPAFAGPQLDSGHHISGGAGSDDDYFDEELTSVALPAKRPNASVTSAAAAVVTVDVKHTPKASEKTRNAAQNKAK